MFPFLWKGKTKYFNVYFNNININYFCKNITNVSLQRHKKKILEEYTRTINSSWFWLRRHTFHCTVWILPWHVLLFQLKINNFKNKLKIFFTQKLSLSILLLKYLLNPMPSLPLPLPQAVRGWLCFAPRDKNPQGVRLFFYLIILKELTPGYLKYLVKMKTIGRHIISHTRLQATSWIAELFECQFWAVCPECQNWESWFCPYRFRPWTLLPSTIPTVF